MERSYDTSWRLTQLYRCLHGRQTRIFRFSSTQRGKNWQNCSFTAALVGGKLDFSVFLRSERRKTGNCSFTVALIGGKPVFLRSERRKAGNCSFTAALFCGKVDFPVFLRSERRKTGNCMYAAGTYGGNLSIRFFILSPHILHVGGSWVAGLSSAK
ncbi:hypothetical protein AAC387_Pa08g2472 [Persea americana]